MAKRHQNFNFISSSYFWIPSQKIRVLSCLTLQRHVRRDNINYNMQISNQPYSRKNIWCNNSCYLTWPLKILTTLGVLILHSMRSSLMDQTSSEPGLAFLILPTADIVSFIIAPSITIDKKSTKWGRKNIQTNYNQAEI